jgi:hypothetical protein
MCSTSSLVAVCSLEELEAQITALAGQLNAANFRWLMLIAEFDRRHGWADGKLPSCAHWLNFKVGLNLGAAREKVRVAHALAGLPRIAAAMGRGELSYSKVRALTRVACPATEEGLLMIALHGTAYHVERLVQGYRRAQEAQELSREAQQHTNRSVTYSYTEDGSLILRARLPAVAGAVLIKALDAALESLPENAISAKGVAERPIPYESRRADALAAVAESFLAHSDTPSTSADRYQVIVHVDAQTLQERAAGRCEPAARARESAGRAARCRAQDAQHPTEYPPRAQQPRRRLSLPRLHPPTLRRRASHRALGRGRRNEARQSRDPVPSASPLGA